MEITYNASLPAPHPAASRGPASTPAVPRREAALGKKANSMPIERGVEGEWLKGRDPASAPPAGDGYGGLTYRGEYAPGGSASGRRAVSVYLYHAGLTPHSRAHAIDVYA